MPCFIDIYYEEIIMIFLMMRLKFVDLREHECIYFLYDTLSNDCLIVYKSVVITLKFV